MRACLDRDGKPTAAGTRLRPDFVAAGMEAFTPMLPDADDEELLVEAMFVALLNHRPAVLEYFASRGAPINSTACGWPLIKYAVGNAMTDMVECLLRCGADLDLRTSPGDESARDLARQMLDHSADRELGRRIAELCGIDVDAVFAAQPPPPVIAESLQRALTLASDDAARLAQTSVSPENLLFGLLRVGGRTVHFLNNAGRMQVERFRADLSQRLAPSDDLVMQSELPLDEAAQRVIDAAVAFATQRRQSHVEDLNLLYALTRSEVDPVVSLLARYGTQVAFVNEHLLQF